VFYVSLGGPEFEEWLKRLLERGVMVCLHENPYCTWSTPFASKWRERLGGLAKLVVTEPMKIYEEEKIFNR
jgi:hypothetical protein